MLCDVCISIDFFVKKHKQYPHHANLHAVYQAAEQGCELCQALLVNVEDAALGRIPVEVEMESRVFYHIWYWKGNDFNYFSHEWDPPVEGVHLIEFSGERTGRKQCWEAIFEVYVEHGCAPGLARAVSGRPIFPTPDSEGCFSLINSWMRECSERHKGYCPSQIEAPLPTRVLDIGMDGGDGGIFLKFTNFAEVGAYVTLSHCWGKGPHFRTTSSNIANFEHSIALGELPSTFRDAVIVSRKLGFRFLWIDSLCIIQDSHEDWVKEAASMHLYYKRSALTIAVDSARGDQEGFLHLERRSDPPVAVFPSTSYDNYVQLTPIRPSALSLTQNAANSRVDDILIRRPRERDKDVLSERGWTLQENILSPRTIHYSATELKWECQKEIHSERNLVCDNTFKSTKQGFTSLSNRVSDYGLKHLAVFEQWYRILNDYSKRFLSVPSDKLPAISGLVSDVHSHMPATYKAGIWLEDACCGLAWSYCERGIKPDFYRAPSWSWAAMDYSGFHKSSLSDELFDELYDYSVASVLPYEVTSKADVLGCEVLLKDNDPYGGVLGGELTLRTFWITWPQKELRSSGDMWSMPATLVSTYDATTRTDAPICSFDELPKEKYTYHNPDFYIDVSLVQILRTKCYHVALLLKPAEGEGNKGKFVKIGIASFLPELDVKEGGWVKRDVSII